MKILFVDDEANVRQGLQRLLRPLRHKWQMSFAEDAAAALRVLESDPHEVIVSDMRMPGMNGVALLESIRERYPGTIRIMLSGHSDVDLSTVEPTVIHQYIAKPCTAETLIGTIEKLSKAISLFGSAKIKGLINKLPHLPSQPSLYLDIVAELQSRRASFEAVTAIIEKDVAMVAKILQVANSSLYRNSHQPVTQVSQAVRSLGVDLIKHLVLTYNVVSQMDERQERDMGLQKVMSHSIACGRLAKEIYASMGGSAEMIVCAQTAGILHDIGLYVLMVNLPDNYAAMNEESALNPSLLWRYEIAEFGASHAEVGAYLLGLWGLPEVIIDTVLYHHSPSKCPDQSISPLTAVHIADSLTNAEDEPGAGLDVDYLARLGVMDKLPLWQEAYRKLFRTNGDE